MHPNAATLEVTGITRGHHRTMRARDSGDLHISLPDGAPQSSPGSRDLRSPKPSERTWSIAPCKAVCAGPFGRLASDLPARVLRYRLMSQTITVRLTPELAEWLAATARKTGLTQGKIIRDQLEKARASQGKSFLRLAGCVSGPRDLSSRKGFSRSGRA